MKKHLPALALIIVSILAVTPSLYAQKSVARLWNEALLQSIREDFARPPVHARNLYHVSLALYDAWAVYDTVAQTYLLGKTVGNFYCPFNGVPMPADIEAAREEAMSYAAYRVLKQRFAGSPNAINAFERFDTLMSDLGYNFNYNGVNYSNGNPADLGNYLGACILAMGYQDGANEQFNYASQFYLPVNPPLMIEYSGNPNILDPNRWQPLHLSTAIDQNGNPIPSNQIFQSPEWGNVAPFAMTDEDRDIFQRNGNTYYVYHDPGPFPTLDTTDGGGLSDEYRWNFELVTAWGAHLTPNDSVMWDISPRGFGNNQSYPQTLAELHDFYDLMEGGDHSPGREINPKTGQPYTPQIVPRGDYTRVLAQFWADGPNSETPPGHWFAILNYVMEQPGFEKRYNGKGPVLPDLEWDAKAYFTLGGALHDAAISAWGIKGWYDGVRPVSALRYMAQKGQSSDPLLPNFNPAGVMLIPGRVEVVLPGDQLAGFLDENVGKIKFFTWRGPHIVNNPLTDTSGVGWVLADHWWPFQRKTFVTPPFAGYISGHSTYSRAAAEVLTLVTGDEYFPGGMGEFHITANSNFLGVEKGPSVDVTLQWATYRDASDQTSLSRIWGGIHPPVDDIPGRLIGMEVGQDAFAHARTFFYQDQDGDGFYSYEDCDDNDATMNPGAAELCDGMDNDCNGLVDDLPVFAYFADVDGDGYGDAAIGLDTCLSVAPAGYVDNNQDCNDADPDLNPSVAEICDGMDNNCDGTVDEGLTMFVYYMDADNDQYGDATTAMATCLASAPAGFVPDSLDCDDNDPAVFPGALEIVDNIDNNCDGLIDEIGSSTIDWHNIPFSIYPNPFSDRLNIEFQPGFSDLRIRLITTEGVLIRDENWKNVSGTRVLDVPGQSAGMYFLQIKDLATGRERVVKLIRLSR